MRGRKRHRKKIRVELLKALQKFQRQFDLTNNNAWYLPMKEKDKWPE